ncbi:MAG TPA: fumarylacetoacetate hydrolase, partial [Hyphomicrobiaceae bacterium]|nr:fumarylacetoacetate hydrolase [Hyphomicrobiaceae bacterium]
MPSLADYMSVAASLPRDGSAGALAGRVWLPMAEGPAVVAVRGEELYDISKLTPTMRDLCEAERPAEIVRAGKGEPIGALADVLGNTPAARREPAKPWLLAPIDLQAIKAAGVTFPRSMLERVIEEQARGAPEKAEALRKSVAAHFGGNLANLVPGSKEAAELKQVLIAQRAWSQYLEVGIGPDAEIFTKAQPMSAVGHGMDAGLHPISTWNNPEPEVVLLVSSGGAIVGATLGNDVNLRD